MEPLSVTRGKLGLCVSASYTPMMHQGIEVSPHNHSLGCKTMSCTSPDNKQQKLLTMLTKCSTCILLHFHHSNVANRLVPRMDLPAILGGAHMVGQAGSCRQSRLRPTGPYNGGVSREGGQPLQPSLSADVRQPGAYMHQRPVHRLLIQPWMPPWIGQHWSFVDVQHHIHQSSRRQQDLHVHYVYWGFVLWPSTQHNQNNSAIVSSLVLDWCS